MMNKRKKRILILSLILLLVVIGIVAGVRFLPINKFLKRQSGSYSEFTNSKPAQIHAPNSLYYDMEVPPGKEIPGDIYKGIAHSGQYSGKSFGNNSFGVLVEKPVDEIEIDNLSAVSMSCWVYVFPTTNEINGALVFAASNNVGVNVCWKGIYLSGEGIPRGKWFKISGYADLSEVKFKPGYKLQIYFWNNSRSDILADDYRIVFGAEKSRKGDSAFVDMTSGNAFVPKFNYPPFQNFYLDKVDIGNQNSSFLICSEVMKEGEITSKDLIIAGNFLRKTGVSDDLLVIKTDGTPELFPFCTETGRFSKVVFSSLSGQTSGSKTTFVAKGKFVDGSTDQILLGGENGLMLGTAEISGNPCNSSAVVQAKFKVLWKSSGELYKGVKIGSSTHLICGDFNGDNLTELLAVKENGSWALLKFNNRKEAGKWELISAGEQDPAKAWNYMENEVNITSGRFLKNAGQDVLLTVFRGRKRGDTGYLIYSYHPDGGRFVSHFPGSQNLLGKTIGLDTLKTSDQFFTGDFNGDGEQDVFRYNQDWRYDLKQIKFNDSTFRILGNVDFRGYTGDHNPKYYEQLVLLRFMDPASTGFLVIARNSKEYPFLPNAVQRYSFTKSPIK